MPHLNDIQACSLRRAGIAADVVGTELMRDGVIAISQRQIANSHRARATHTIASILFSANAIAAQVMMSKFPA